MDRALRKIVLSNKHILFSFAEIGIKNEWYRRLDDKFLIFQYNLMVMKVKAFFYN